MPIATLIDHVDLKWSYLLFLNLVLWWAPSLPEGCLAAPVYRRRVPEKRRMG